MAGALLAGGASGPSTVFEGTWITIDPGDGSGMTLVVGSGPKPDVYFEDGYASGDACADEAVKRFTARGTGAISADRLAMTFPNGGGCGSVTVAMDGVVTHDPATDTLAGLDGLVWQRALNQPDDPADVPETPAPSTPAQPTAVPTSDPTPEPSSTTAPVDSPLPSECIDLSAGGTYSEATGGLTIVVSVPEAPAVPWQGARGEFFLASGCADGGEMSIIAMTATRVFSSSCMPDAEEIATFAAAVARLDAPTGPDISERVDLTIDGHPAARYDVTDLSTCPDGFGLWGGTTLGPGETGSIYVIDVDGVLLAVELNRDGTQAPAEIAEAQAIVESMRIER
jgi:hypothetical protein